MTTLPQAADPAFAERNARKAVAEHLRQVSAATVESTRLACEALDAAMAVRDDVLPPVGVDGGDGESSDLSDPAVAAAKHAVIALWGASMIAMSATNIAAVWDDPGDAPDLEKTAQEAARALDGAADVRRAAANARQLAAQAAARHNNAGAE